MLAVRLAGLADDEVVIWFICAPKVVGFPGLFAFGTVRI
jgi:hypothetical protein